MPQHSDHLVDNLVAAPLQAVEADIYWSDNDTPHVRLQRWAAALA